MKNNNLIEKLLIRRNWLALKGLRWFDVRNLFGLFLPMRYIIIKNRNAKWEFIEVCHKEDFSTYYSIWCREDYRTEKLDYDVIFDFGANIGLSSLYFRETYPKAEIHSYEPDNDTFRILARNVKSHIGILLFNGAVGLETGIMDFYHSHTGKTSGLIREFVNDYNTKVSAVQVYALREILSPYLEKKVLIKLDVEGLEMDLLQELARLPFKEVCHVVFEKDINYDQSKLSEFKVIWENSLIGYVKL